MKNFLLDGKLYQEELMLMKIYTEIQPLKLDFEILEIVVQALWAKGASQ